MDCGAIVVAGVEVGVIVAALQLEPRFQDLGGDVDGRGGEVGDEACENVRSRDPTYCSDVNIPATKYDTDGATP